MFLYPILFKQIRSFDLKKGLCSTIENKLISITKKEVFHDITGILWLKPFHDFTIGLDSLNKPVIIKEDEIDKSLQNMFRVSSVNYPFINFYKKADPRTFGTYNFETKTIEFETTNTIGRDIFQEHIVNDNSEVIEFRTVFSSTVLWSFSLSQLPSIPHKEFMNPDAPWEIKKFIGVLENKLWVALNHRTIIALNCETGELAHIISEIPGFDLEWIQNSIPDAESTQIVENENVLLGFADTYIWLIDAVTGAISIKNYDSYFKESRIMKYRTEFIIDGDLLFFLSDVDPKVGCFNRRTELLEWQYAFEKTENGEYPRLIEIQGNRKKLGVKDLANNLYIFEPDAE
jgi:hypothetical protein